MRDPVIFLFAYISDLFIFLFLVCFFHVVFCLRYMKTIRTEKKEDSFMSMKNLWGWRHWKPLLWKGFISYICKGWNNKCNSSQKIHEFKDCEIRLQSWNFWNRAQSKAVRCELATVCNRNNRVHQLCSSCNMLYCSMLNPLLSNDYKQCPWLGMSAE
jgi:hypothetical protein